MTTANKDLTIQAALNLGNPNVGWAAMQKAKAGDALQGFQKTLTGLASASSFDLTTLDDPDDVTVKLPAALAVSALRVTAGAAVAGPRLMSDGGDTAAQIGTSGVYIATLSDDGKTITFEAGVTAFVINYVPKQDLTVNLENE